MKYLAQTAMWLSMLFSCVRSLKYLRRITAAPGTTSGVEHEKAVSALMFWVIYALLVVFEEYLEWAVRWFPGFYYAKAGFVVLISVPALRITHLVFNDGVVVLFNAMNEVRLRLDAAYNDGRAVLQQAWEAAQEHAATWPPLRKVAAEAPFVVLAVLFPHLCEDPASRAAATAATSSSSSSAGPPGGGVDATLPPPPPPPPPPQLRRRYVPNGTAPPSVPLPPPPPPLPPALVMNNPRTPTASAPASPLPKAGPGSPTASPLRIETHRRLAALAPFVRLDTPSTDADGCSTPHKTAAPAAAHNSSSSSSSSSSSPWTAATAATSFSPERLLETALSPLKYGIVKALLDFDLGHKPTNAANRERRRTTLLAAFRTGRGRGSVGSPSRPMVDPVGDATMPETMS